MLTPTQCLKLDHVAATYAERGLRITTRQTLRFHGIIETELKVTMQAINSAVLDTIAACGDTSLRELNHWLAGRSAEQRIAWALDNSAGLHALSSSFGAQAAVSLHMVTRQAPELPVILVDTGYLFPETHRFAEQLRVQLDLNIKLYRPDPALAWSEAEVAGLHRSGVAGFDRYNQVHKVEPMQRALRELGVGTWIAGLRRSQSSSRAAIDIVERRDGRWKLHPLADWSNRDVRHYLQRHRLPYHPLWHDGYVSIGDTHSTRRLQPGMREEDTRFFGLKRECGLHFDDRDTPPPQLS